MNSLEASQQAYEIAKILEADTTGKPDLDIIETPRRLAENLGRMDSHCPETLHALWRALDGSQAHANLLLIRVAKKIHER